MSNDKAMFPMNVGKFFCPCCNNPHASWRAAVNHCAIKKVKFESNNEWWRI